MSRVRGHRGKRSVTRMSCLQWPWELVCDLCHETHCPPQSGDWKWACSYILTRYRLVVLRKAAPGGALSQPITVRVWNSFVVEYTSARHRVRVHRRGIDASSERWLPDLMRCRRLHYRHCRLMLWRWYINLTTYEILFGPLYMCSGQITIQKWFLHLCFSSDCTLGLGKDVSMMIEVPVAQIIIWLPGMYSGTSK